MTNTTSQAVHKDRLSHGISTHVSTFVITLCLTLSMAQGAAATPSCNIATLQGKTLQETAAIECPAGGCLPDSTGTPATGPITDCVEAGYEPPLPLRPDYGMGYSFSGLGSAQRGGGCNPDGTCATYGGVTGVPAVPGPSSPQAPAGENLAAGSVTLLAGGGLPSLACGGAAPMLSVKLDMDTNLPPTISFGNIINLGASIQIGMPPINVPKLDVTIPTINLPSLPVPPDISLDLPDISLSIPTITLPTIEADLSLPPLSIDLPCMDPSCLPVVNLSADISLPSFSLPSLQLPVISIPTGFSLNTSVTLATDLVTNLMVSGLLNSGLNLGINVNLPSLNVPSFDVIANLLGAAACPGSVMSLATNAIQLVVPPITVSAGIPETNVVVPAVTVGATMTVPGNEPMAFSLQGGIANGNVIEAPSGIAFVVDASAVTATGVNRATGATETVANAPAANQVVSFQPSTTTIGGQSVTVSPALVTLPYSWKGNVVGAPSKIASNTGCTTSCKANTVMVGYTALSANSTNTPSNSVILYKLNTSIPQGSTSASLGTPVQASSTLTNMQTGPKGTTSQPDSQLNLDPYWVCLPLDSIFGCTWQWDPNFLAAIIQSPYSSANPNMAVATSSVVVNADQAATTQAGVTPPAGSFMSIPTGTPVGFSLTTPGATIGLPAGGTITDVSGNKISVPQRGVLIALGPDPVTGKYGVVAGFTLNTTANAGQIRLPGTTPGSNPATSPLITPDTTTGNVVLTYDQLSGFGDTAANGNIIEYPTTQKSLNIATTEVSVPPSVPVPTSTTTSALTTPQDPSSLASTSR